MVKKLLVDLDCGEAPVDSIPNRDEDGDSDGNGADIVNDGGRDDTNTRAGGDMEDDTSC